MKRNYLKIQLNVGGTYIIAPEEISTLINEIKQAIDQDNTEYMWTVKIIRMNEQEFTNLPDFSNH
jgi:sRNA-binding carbon storage regulator CsrA